jgi:hypothetical protein
MDRFDHVIGCDIEHPEHVWGPVCPVHPVAMYLRFSLGDLRLVAGPPIPVDGLFDGVEIGRRVVDPPFVEGDSVDVGSSEIIAEPAGCYLIAITAYAAERDRDDVFDGGEMGAVRVSVRGHHLNTAVAAAMVLLFAEDVNLPIATIISLGDPDPGFHR